MNRETWAQKDRTWKEQILRLACTYKTHSTAPYATLANIACWADTSWDFLSPNVREDVERFLRIINYESR